MAPSPKYDPQRSEVYRMESHGLPGLNRTKYTRKDTALLLSTLCKEFGVPEPKLRFVPAPKWSGLWFPGGIHLSTDKRRSGRSPATLVHEFAHHVMAEWDPLDTLYPHGPEFVGIYGDCLAMAGLIPWNGWQDLCKQYGVECLDTATIRTVAGLKRAVKKRAAEAARKTSPSKS